MPLPEHYIPGYWRVACINKLIPVQPYTVSPCPSPASWRSIFRHVLQCFSVYFSQVTVPLWVISFSLSMAVTFLGEPCWYLTLVTGLEVRRIGGRMNLEKDKYYLMRQLSQLRLGCYPLAKDAGGFCRPRGFGGICSPLHLPWCSYPRSQSPITSLSRSYLGSGDLSLADLPKVPVQPSQVPLPKIQILDQSL